MIRAAGGSHARRGVFRSGAVTAALAIFAFAASLLGGAAFARADVRVAKAPSQRLRVLTFNAFGIPRLSPAIDERMAAMGAAIERLDVDVVLMQEIWRARDAENLSRAFREAGFVDTRSFASAHWLDRGRGGLLIASKLPITAEAFEPFEDGELPHIPWHVDWRGGKGFLVVRVATSLGEVAFLSSHTQASYATGQYEALRVAQVAQMVRALRGPGRVAAVASPSDPLFVAGDLNAPPAAPSIRLLEHLTGARVANRDLDVDLVLARGGTTVEARIVAASSVLAEPIALPDGSSTTLSDHPGVLAEYELTACRGACGAPPTEEEGSPKIVEEALATLDDDARRTQWLRAGTAAAAALSAWLGLRAARRVTDRARRRRERSAAAIFGLWCLFWAMWWTYTAFVFAPAHLASLARARTEIASADADPAGSAARRHAPVTVGADPPR